MVAAKWVGFGGSLLLLILLAALGVVSGLQRRARSKALREEELEPESEDSGFSREAEEVVAEDFSALQRRAQGLGGEERKTLSKEARLQALEEKEGPMPDFIRDLFDGD